MSFEISQGVAMLAKSTADVTGFNIYIIDKRRDRGYL